MESSAQQRPGVKWELVAEAAEEEQSRGCSAIRTQRNESCVTASASEVGIASPVTLRVAARTGELMRPCGNCGPNAEPEGASAVSLLGRDQWMPRRGDRVIMELLESV